jgi:hypothetical protein
LETGSYKLLAIGIATGSYCRALVTQCPYRPGGTAGMLKISGSVFDGEAIAVKDKIISISQTTDEHNTANIAGQNFSQIFIYPRTATFGDLARA